MTWVDTLCRSAYRAGLVHAGMALTEPRHRVAKAGRFQILVYHRVGDVSDPFVFAVPPSVFDDHVRYLRHHFHVMPLRELLAAAAHDEVPSRALAITFDDGYEDTYKFAYPILRRHGVPATVYVTTGLVDADDGMWNDRVGAAIRDTRKALLVRRSEQARLPLTTIAEREHALQATLEDLKALRPAERDAEVAAIERTLEIRRASAPRLFRAEQMVEMSTGGIEFGAHTVNHPILALLSPREAADEIGGSKRAIENWVQRPVVDFAYPNGRADDYNADTKRILAAEGFVSAVTTTAASNTCGTDRLELCRFGPLALAPELFVTKLWWNRRVSAAEVAHGA